MPTTTIYFIRHGQSIANTKDLVTGDHNDTLSVHGVRQTTNTSPWLRRLLIQECGSIGHIQTSQFHRAKQTAAIIFPDYPIIIEPRLNETDAGDVKNLSFSEFIKTYPDFWKQFNPLKSYPNGESHYQLYERAKAWLLDHLDHPHNNQNIIVVSHSGILAALLHFLLKIPLEKFPIYRSPHVGLSAIKLTHKNKIISSCDMKYVGLIE